MMPFRYSDGSRSIVFEGSNAFRLSALVLIDSETGEILWFIHDESLVLSEQQISTTVVDRWPAEQFGPADRWPAEQFGSNPLHDVSADVRGVPLSAVILGSVPKGFLQRVPVASDVDFLGPRRITAIIIGSESGQLKIDL